MHEISIAQDLVELAAERLHAAGGGRAAAVHVRVGALAGVVPAALRSAFAVAARGTALRGARLFVEEVAVRVLCTTCEVERDVAPAQSRRCAACGAIAATLVSGLELDLASLEVA